VQRQRQRLRRGGLQLNIGTAESDLIAHGIRRELLVDHLSRLPDWRADPLRLLDGLIRRVENLNGREFDDDVAGLLLGSR